MLSVRDLYEYDPRDESEEERFARFRERKAKRIAEGKCWQCAKPIADCDCPNLAGRDGRKPAAPAAKED